MKHRCLHELGRAKSIVWAVAGSLVVFGGCGRGGPERAVVCGNVTYRNAPIKFGEISFIPIKETQAPMSAVPIVDGRYDTSTNGGVPVGTHHIEIVAWHELTTANVPKGMPVGRMPRDLYLPAKYNTQSELEITIEPGSGKVVRDFALTD